MALPIKDKIKLGLDLKGGISLVLQVRTDDSLNGETDQEINRFLELFKKNAVTYTTAVKERPGRFAINGLNVDQQAKVRELVDQYTADWDTAYLPDKVTFTLKPAVALLLRDQAVAQTLETIRNRIDQYGVSEPVIQRQGNDRVVVELPGVDDPERVKELIKVTAVLNWKLVKGGPAEDEGNPPPAVRRRRPRRRRNRLGRRQARPSRLLPRGKSCDAQRHRPPDRPPRDRRMEQSGRRLHPQPRRRPPLRTGHRGQRRASPGHHPGRQAPIGSQHQHPDRRFGHHPGARSPTRKSTT